MCYIGHVRAAWFVFVLLSCSGVAAGQEGEIAKFGTTVVIPTGLEGRIYNIHRNSSKLPNFDKRKPVGVIYTTALNIPPQDFAQGFPGVTKKFEWFAIDYHGRFWIEKPGEYLFSLMSDDGSKLYVDDVVLINNDEQHPPKELKGRVALERGVHRIRISYFQGPRFQVALVLQVSGPGEAAMRVFSTDEFKPPPDADMGPLK